MYKVVYKCMNFFIPFISLASDMMGDWRQNIIIIIQ